MLYAVPNFEAVWVYMQALYNGVPQIFVPLLAEQPWNADQIEWLGAGIHLPCKRPLERNDLASMLKQAMQQAASAPNMRQAAQQIGQVMRAHRWSAAAKAASKPTMPVVHSTCSHIKGSRPPLPPPTLVL